MLFVEILESLIVCVCAAIEWIKPLFLEGGRFLNQENKQVALLGQVYSGEQLDYLPAMMGGTEIVVINDLDWQVINCNSKLICESFLQVSISCLQQNLF